MVADMCHEIDTAIDEATIKEMQATKEKGLMAVHTLVRAKSHVKKGVRYELLNISKNTALKILDGSINTFEKLENSCRKDQLANVQILCRIQDDNIKEVKTCVIEY